MYVEKFVVSLKVDGKFLRDNESTVRLPFNSEYSLYLKNLESRDCVVKVFIDNKDVLDGKEIIIRSGSFLELEGFLEGMNVKNKFKFIELTKEIEKFRGYDPEDSLIRVEVKYQKPKPVVQEYISHWTYTYPHYKEWNEITYSDHTFTSNNTSGIYSRSVGGMSSGNSEVKSLAMGGVPMSDVGITVKGQETNQIFGNGYIGDLESVPHIIILRLSGYKENKMEVKQYITTKEKVKCLTCGKENSTEFKFCPKCGTFIG